MQILLKSVPEGSIENKSASAQIMDWRRVGDMPSPEAMLTKFIGVYMRQWVNGRNKPDNVDFVGFLSLTSEE